MEVGVEVLSDFEFSMLEEIVSSVENKYQQAASQRGPTNNSEHPKTGAQVHNNLQNNTQTHQITNNFGSRTHLNHSALNHSNTGYSNSTQPQIVHSNTFQPSNNKMVPSMNPSQQQAPSGHYNSTNYNSTPYSNSSHFNNSTPHNTTPFNSTQYNNSSHHNSTAYNTTQQHSQSNNLQMLKESLSRGNQTQRANPLQKQQFTAQTSPSTSFPSSSTPFTPSAAPLAATTAPTSSTVSNKLPLRVELQLVARDRFGTSHTTDERVNGIFRAVPGAEFGECSMLLSIDRTAVQEEKRWSFPVSQYNALCTALQPLSYVTPLHTPTLLSNWRRYLHRC
jgi:hypothetical protein